MGHEEELVAAMLARGGKEYYSMNWGATWELSPLCPKCHAKGEEHQMLAIHDGEAIRGWKCPYCGEKVNLSYIGLAASS